MPNQVSAHVPSSGRFSVVHVETIADGDIDCLSVLVYDESDGLLKSFYEARIARDSRGGNGSTVALSVALDGLLQTCRDTTLVAFEVAAVRQFISDACARAGTEYPFLTDIEIDVKTMAVNRLGPVGAGASGLREAAQRLGIRTLPPGDAPSWGAVAIWYVLRRLVES